MVDDTYDSFVEKVSDGRRMTRKEVDAIGGGRVWSGENALEIGLIDRYGGLRDAIGVAASMAGLEKYRVIDLPKLENPIDQFLRELAENTRAKIVRRELGQFYPYFQTLYEIEGAFGIQARLPFKFELY
jgi:protease-4